MTDPTTERPTGATDEQIDAAVAHWLASFGDRLSRIQTDSKGRWREELEHYASHLVPPGYRIVRADADVRERAIESAMTRLGEPHPTATITETVDATLAALLEDGR